MSSTIKVVASKLYNDRFEQFGRDVRTVGWGNRADQLLRFEVLFRGIDPRGKTILDVGCGLGDLVPYLQERTDGDFRYIGIDVAERLIQEAKITHGNESCTFICCDVFDAELPKVDIAVLSGALSLRVEGIDDYAQRTLRRMYDLTSEVACLNFLTTYVDYELEKNQHYQPETVFGWARVVTKCVNLLHDYPLYEFTLQLVHGADPVSLDTGTEPVL